MIGRDYIGAGASCNKGERLKNRELTQVAHWIFGIITAMDLKMELG
jgi:hypothetical protein